jgi:hypothetical protein
MDALSQGRELLHMNLKKGAKLYAAASARGATLQRAERLSTL